MLISSEIEKRFSKATEFISETRSNYSISEFTRMNTGRHETMEKGRSLAQDAEGTLLARSTFVERAELTQSNFTRSDQLRVALVTS